MSDFGTMAIDRIGRDLQQPNGASLGAISARVLVVDDDLLVAQAFVFALVQQGFSARFVVPATLQHLQDAIAWKPHLALLDVNLPEGGPVAFVELLRQSGIKIVVKGGNREHDQLLEYVRASSGVVLDSCVALDELVQMLRGLLLETPPPEIVESRLTTRLTPFLILTPREQHVLAELMEGRTADAIAKSSWVALSTVRSQIKSILQKLGVNSQLAAVALARQAGWTYSGGSEAQPRWPQNRHIDDSPLASENPMAR
jgi:DNA-binding NarL/FixJ family response regulator